MIANIREFFLDSCRERWILLPAIALAILSVAVPLGLLIVQWTTPPPLSPLTFPDLPNPIEDPTRTDVPLPITATPRFEPGDVVPTMPYRCVTDDGGSGLGVLTYTFTRALYYAGDDTKAVDMPGGSVSAPVGCQRTRSSIQFVPLGTRPGTYYFAGTATARGLRRTATVFWRTAQFEVVP